MSKRTIAMPLWFLTGWMIGSMTALVVGLPWWTAPFLAITVAAVVYIDPAHTFWVQDHSRVAGDESHRQTRLSALSARSRRSDTTGLAARSPFQD